MWLLRTVVNDLESDYGKAKADATLDAKKRSKVRLVARGDDA